MTTAETTNYRGCRIEIHYDEASGFNPRDDYSNLSRLVFAPSSRYEMPNEVDFPFGDYDYDEESPEDETFAEWCVRKLHEDYSALYIVPVYRFEHSCVAYRVGASGNPFHDPWDSGQVGYAIVTPESAKEIGTSPEDFAEIVAAEVDEYSAWANGEVYGWIAVDPDGETIQSCWGYLGLDSWKEMEGEGRSAIDWWIEDRESRYENLLADSMAELLATH